MKKLLAILLALTLVFSMAACSSGGGGGSEPAPADGGEGELDMLRYQVEELDRAGLSEADETIAERHAAAAHAEEIVEGANAITEALGGDDSAAEMLIRPGPVFRAVARHPGRDGPERHHSLAGLRTFP